MSLRYRDCQLLTTIGLSDPWVEVAVRSTKVKTKVQKKTLSPEWNERFTFDFTGLDPDVDEVNLVCWDWNAIKQSDYMGEATVLLKDIYYDRPTWLSLYSTTGERVTGEILVTFARVDATGSSTLSKSTSVLGGLLSVRCSVRCACSRIASKVRECREAWMVQINSFETEMTAV